MIMNRSLLALTICALSGLAHAALSQEEVQLLEQIFAPTNSARQVEDGIDTFFPESWDSRPGVALPPHTRELCYNILTNFTNFRCGDIEFWGRSSLSGRYHLFSSMSGLWCRSNDLQYVECCADFIGREMQPVQFRSDIHPLIIRGYNTEVKNYRSMMLGQFSFLVGRFEHWLDESDIGPFRTNITTRARLTEREAKRVFEPTEEQRPSWALR